ncbi:MAG: histidine phosphatase family protein [Deltaproteobacteria bacterium]|nr:histidine phosphatase family protein [Deltaproteobacteria bacterium]
MATLWLLRHGQASAHAQDYDQLSTLGEQQAQLLGELWGRQGIVIDRLVHGPRRRQRGTARIVFDALQKAGHTPRAISEDDDLDELRIDGIMASPQLLREQVPELCPMLDAFEALEDPAQKSRMFLSLGTHVMRAWAADRVHVEGVERFADFELRVRVALERARLGAGKGARIVCATSAGVVAVSARQHLGLTPERTIDLMMRTRNSSISEVLFSGDRATWSSFNEVPHLAERPELVTLV